MFRFIILFIFVSINISFAQINEISGFSIQQDQQKNYLVKDILKEKKALVVFFLSKDCPCSKAYLPYLGSLSVNYPDFYFLGIHAKKNTSVSDFKSYLSGNKTYFDLILDQDLKMTDLFQALKTPHVFIIDKTGEIIYQGGVANSMNPERASKFYLQDALNEIRQDGKPIVKETKALGCYIVR